MGSKNTETNYGKERIATLILSSELFDQIWGFFFLFFFLLSIALEFRNRKLSTTRRDREIARVPPCSGGTNGGATVRQWIRAVDLRKPRLGWLGLTGFSGRGRQPALLRTTADQNQKCRLGLRNDFEAHLEEHVGFIIHR